MVVSAPPDALLRGRLQLFQPAHGPRVSLDALLLADFARYAGVGPLLDLGCGTGVIALALAVAEPRLRAVGIELQPDLAELARRNCALNGVAERVEIVTGDIARAHALPLAPSSFERVVTNPPFFRARPAPRAERAVARHEIACTLADVLAAARRFVRPRGRVHLVYPAETLAELLAAVTAAGLRTRALRFVHSFATAAAKRVLLEAALDYRGCIEIRPPLVVHEPDRRYTAEAATILGDEERGPTDRG